MRENEQCLKQQTGSCEGCPVLSLLRDELRNNTIYDPRVEKDQKIAALKIAADNCPEGQVPDIKQLVVESKGNGWTGRYVSINLR